MNELGDSIGRPRATSQRAAKIAMGVFMAAGLLVAIWAGCNLLGCGPIHVHLGERHYCNDGYATTQPAYIGSSNPDIILGVEP